MKETIDGIYKEAIFGYIGKARLLKRVSSAFGPHTAEALKNTPEELNLLYKMIKRVPKGGTEAGVVLRDAITGAGPGSGIAKIIGKNKLDAETFNKLLPHRKQFAGAVPKPPGPEGLFEKGLQQMKRHPLLTGAGGLTLGAAATSMLRGKSPAPAPEPSPSSRRNVFVT